VNPAPALSDPFDAAGSARDLAATAGTASGEELLREAVAAFGRQGIALVTSFGAESAVLLHMVSRIDPDLTVLFLDTGKLFGETLRYRDRLIKLLGLTNVRTLKPDAAAVAEADADGMLWRRDANACCALRKTVPLEKALAPFRAWITGRKRFQGATRSDLSLIEHADGRVKLNPLAGWSRSDLESWLDRHDLPRHPLEEDGYLSIGCMPCTDRVAPGEDIRSGRWRGQAKTECGIHLSRPATPVGALNGPPGKTVTMTTHSAVRSSALPSLTPSAVAAPSIGPVAGAPLSASNDDLPNHLDQLESQSLFILREAKHRLKKLALLWSLGKDSNVLIWLCRKAFLGEIPFPVAHLDTGLEFPESYEFRDRYAQEWGLNLIADACPPVEMTDPTLPPGTRIAARKSLGLAGALERYQFDGLITGIRRDEQATRAKERIFSPRRLDGSWEAADQPPEFWDHYTVDRRPGTHTRVHPLLGWTELDVWRYIKRENIPLVPLYFAKDGKRFRSLGEIGITFPVDSQAGTIDEIIAELETTRTPERAGRSMDHEAEDAFERLRATGYL
jgi:sulfate adenylyltransferase subunit 2